MARTIRFHLDEQGASALARGLRHHGIDVTTTPEVGLLSATDAEQLAFAAASGRVMITHDEDFLALSAAGVAHAGITYCHHGKYSLGELIRILVLVWEVYEPEELRGRVEYL
jgi:predicted nuclease of predicted toxin-antitoxin system